MTKEEREVALSQMANVSAWFYHKAVQIGNHPFIEFTGLMNEYIKCCRAAHEQGIDFTECNVHSGVELPMPGYSVNYLNEKLECIFGGRILLKNT